MNTDSSLADRRRGRFLRFLGWNLLGSAVIALPLFFFGSTLIASSFLVLMAFMSVVLAGYFALLRVE